MDDLVIKYRIGIIDDFRNTFSFIDGKLYGENYFFSAGKFGGKKGYQKFDDAIHVFLNFKKIGVFKIREDANKAIKKLIDDCPKQFKSDFEQQREYLF